MGCAGNFESSQHRDYSSVIAAIPIMALLALCAVAGLVTLFGAAFRAAKHGTPRSGGGALAAAGGKGRVSRAPQNPVQVLRCATGRYGGDCLTTARLTD